MLPREAEILRAVSPSLSVLITTVSEQLVLDGNHMQICPDCRRAAGLRVCAIEPHAVIWCPCQRAWTYPTATYEWARALKGLAPATERVDSWYGDGPIPPVALQRFPGLDRLILTIGDIVAAGPVTTHRRLTLSEMVGLAFGSSDPNVLSPGPPGQGWVKSEGLAARLSFVLGIKLRR